MEKRTLGKTGLELSLIGFGGFHLIEVPRAEAVYLLNRYLDQGGNYIETAEGYGPRISEPKIGEAISHRRDEFVLATKTNKRTKAEALNALEISLKLLKTDHLDIWFMHEPQTEEEARAILAPGGAMEAVEEAKQAGKVRFVGVTGHGRPLGLMLSAQSFDYDVLMTGFNYYDRYNFPQIEEQLLPLCQQKGTGVLAMKALGDGYLFRSPELGIRYALSLPVASLVLGINRREYLEQDLQIARDFTPLSDGEREALRREAPELGTYVCRLCGKCSNGESTGLEPEQVFILEGAFDRQMDDGTVPDPDQYALRERLKHWFGQTEWARERYAELTVQVDPEADYSSLNPLCPYGIDIDRKLKLAHAKLSTSGYLY